jgi:leucyl aminopeptidase
MAFSLIDGDAGAVPLTPLTKAQLAAWRETAPVRERDWAAAVGFTGEAGKTALVPDKDGKLGRVLIGVSDKEAAMWAVAGLSETLPEGSYRLDPLPGDVSHAALGWALGTYSFTRYHKKPAGKARLVWPDGRRSRAGRTAG